MATLRAPRRLPTGTASGLPPTDDQDDQDDQDDPPIAPGGEVFGELVDHLLLVAAGGHRAGLVRPDPGRVAERPGQAAMLV
jgi:hypothetical protein